MSELTAEERLAALAARGRATKRPRPAETAAFEQQQSRSTNPSPYGQEQQPRSAILAAVPDDRTERMRIIDSVPPVEFTDSVSRNTRWETPGLIDRLLPSFDWRPQLSGTRVVAGGASAVSFVSMVVAMGPLLQGSDDGGTELDTGGSGETATADNAVPVAPAVSIEAPAVVGADVASQLPAPVDPFAGPSPAAVGSDGQAAQSGAAPAADGSTPADTAPAATAAPTGATTAPTSAATASTAEPATQPQGTQPQGTQPPATQPAATQPPATQPATTAAPTTQPPTTAAPTTAPPTTAAPTTPPPTSGGSGG